MLSGRVSPLLFFSVLINVCMVKQCFNNEVLFEEIAALLREGHVVTIPVKGRSMSPFLADGRDAVTLQACGAGDKLKPGDVVLARTGRTGMIVLHRIIARKGEWLTLQGDANPLQTERASMEDVVGVAVSFTRKGKNYAATSLAWRSYSLWRMHLASCRRLVQMLRRKAAYMVRVVDGHKGAVFLSCLIGVLDVMLSLLFIYLSKQLIDMANGQVQGSLSMRGYALALVLVVVMQLACDAADGWNSVRVQLCVRNALRHRLFARLLQCEWNGLARFHTGDVVNRIERDVASVVSLLTVSLPSFLIIGIQLLAALAFFCCMDRWLPLIVVAVFPFLLLGSRFYLKRTYRYTYKIRQTDGRIQSIIQESLQQRTVIKALEQDGRYIEKLDSQQRLLQKRFMRRTLFSVSSRTCVSAAFSCGYLIVFLWGAARMCRGEITFGVMVAFLQLVGKIQSPLLDMARLVPSLSEAFASIDRLHELEAIPAEDKRTSIRFATTPDVSVEHITFRYAPGDLPVFHDFSCRFDAGSRVAVVGQTGRGKTTLVRLLLALASPEEGSIRLSASGLTVPVSPDTRCNFTYVPQGNTLFSGTIRDNLLMGNPHVNEEAMCKVLHTAMADFVFSLPDGMDTFVGEQGYGLSEGQAQRIAIARALLRDSHIFVLDEATSALDEDTERNLMDNLDTEYAGKTFIFITHHAAVSARCGQIIRIGVSD